MGKEDYKNEKKGHGFLCVPKELLFDNRSKSGRTLQRWEHEAVLEAVHEKTWSRNETYKQRRCIVEHPFGTVKRSLGYSFFLRKRIENVDAEASSMFIAYNLKRLFAVFSTQELIAKFR